MEKVALNVVGQDLKFNDEVSQEVMNRYMSNFPQLDIKKIKLV